MMVPNDQAQAEPQTMGDFFEAVARHKVRLSVYRDYGPDERWQQQPVGLDLELRAVVLGDDPLDGSATPRAAYEALRRLAAWAFGVLDDNPEVDYAFDDFDDHVILEGASTFEVELAGHVFNRKDCRSPLDEEERRAVRQVRERLRSVGVRD